MKIGFNALCADNRSGTGRYATQLLLALAEIDSRNSYAVVLDIRSPLRQRLSRFHNFELHPVEAGNPLKRWLFERKGLGEWMAAAQLDVFHGPAFVAPNAAPVPTIVTVHDLVFRLYPKTVPITRRHYYATAIPRSIRQARAILCDSASTARDLSKHFGSARAKSMVAPLGVEPRFFRAPSPAECERARKAYRLPGRFILTLGTLEPRKNVPNLLRAYARLRARDSGAPDLVVAGRRGWGFGGLGFLARKLQIRSHVRFPGFAAEEDLPTLYHMAEAFACASIYEGFGLPILEAMAAGTPVVAGNNSSIPEVAGDAAWLVEARNPEDIAQALAEALAAPRDALGRAARGRRRAETFTWRATAERTLEAYESVVF